MSFERLNCGSDSAQIERVFAREVNFKTSPLFDSEPELAIPVPLVSFVRSRRPWRPVASRLRLCAMGWWIYFCQNIFTASFYTKSKFGPGSVMGFCSVKSNFGSK